MQTNNRSYLLFVLLLILAASFADRAIIGLVLQDIKVDLNLTDTQLGLLTGLAFALFYSVMGVPIARWADRGNRVTIVALSSALGGVLVMLCAGASSFGHLLLLRIGVAVGEAGCIPTSNSLIGDHFSRSELPRATGIYMLGTSVSLVIGFFLGGWLNQFYGWRQTFLLLGLPSLALAILARCTLREPRREAANTGAMSFIPSSNTDRAPHSVAEPPLRAVAGTLWASRTFRHLLLGFSVLYFFTCGIWKWQPTFFIRIYGLHTGELGTWFAVIYGGGGILGTYMGGALATRYAAHNEHMQLRVMAIMIATFGAISACVYLSRSHYLAFGLMFVAFVGLATYTGPLLAIIQSLVPRDMRAMSIAVIFLFANLIGMGLGPLAVGALSDTFDSLGAGESLRLALLSICPGFAWASWHLWRASSTVADDIRSADCVAEKREQCGFLLPLRQEPRKLPRSADI